MLTEAESDRKGKTSTTRMRLQGDCCIHDKGPGDQYLPQVCFRLTRLWSGHLPPTAIHGSKAAARSLYGQVTTVQLWASDRDAHPREQYVLTWESPLHRHRQAKGFLLGPQEDTGLYQGAESSVDGLSGKKTKQTGRWWTGLAWTRDPQAWRAAPPLPQGAIRIHTPYRGEQQAAMVTGG